MGRDAPLCVARVLLAGFCARLEDLSPTPAERGHAQPLDRKPLPRSQLLQPVRFRNHVWVMHFERKPRACPCCPYSSPPSPQDDPSPTASTYGCQLHRHAGRQTQNKLQANPGQIDSLNAR